jgi:hypothetical protein
MHCTARPYIPLLSYHPPHLPSPRLASPHPIPSHPSPSFPFPFYPNPSHPVLAPPTRPTRTRNQYDSRQSIMRRRAELIQHRGTVHHFVANTCIDFRVNTQGLLVIYCSSPSLFTQLPPLRSSPHSQTDFCNLSFFFFPFLSRRSISPHRAFNLAPGAPPRMMGCMFAFFAHSAPHLPTPHRHGRVRRVYVCFAK